MPNRDIPGVTRDFRDDELKQIEAKWKSSMETKVDALDARVRVIERMVWVGFGGMGVIAGMVGIYGHNIMKVLSA